MSDAARDQQPTWEARPVMISMVDKDRLDNAFYRLDAQLRHVADHGDAVTPQRMAEFHEEAADLIYNARRIILKAEDAEREALTERLNELVAQHVALGLELP